MFEPETEERYTSLVKITLVINAIVSVIAGYFLSNFLESYGINRAIPTPMVFLMLILSEGYYFAERRLLREARKNKSVRTLKQIVYLILPFFAIICLSLLIYDDFLTGTVTLLFIMIFEIISYQKLKNKIKVEGDDKTPLLNTFEIWIIIVGITIFTGIFYYAYTNLIQ